MHCAKSIGMSSSSSGQRRPGSPGAFAARVIGRSWLISSHTNRYLTVRRSLLIALLFLLGKGCCVTYCSGLPPLAIGPDEPACPKCDSHREDNNAAAEEESDRCGGGACVEGFEEGFAGYI